MCGINGFITKKQPLYDMKDRIEAMNHALRHRGPDDSGIFIDSIENEDFSFALGQARLSIIDLSPAGHQPMFYRQDI